MAEVASTRVQMANKLHATNRPIRPKSKLRKSLRDNGGVRSQIRTGLDLEFPDKGLFTGNFRQKLPVPSIVP
jgi:hypothetical protein